MAGADLTDDEHPQYFHPQQRQQQQQQQQQPPPPQQQHQPLPPLVLPRQQQQQLPYIPSGISSYLPFSPAAAAGPTAGGSRRSIVVGRLLSSGGGSSSSSPGVRLSPSSSSAAAASTSTMQASTTAAAAVATAPSNPTSSTFSLSSSTTSSSSSSSSSSPSSSSMVTVPPITASSSLPPTTATATGGSGVAVTTTRTAAATPPMPPPPPNATAATTAAATMMMMMMSSSSAASTTTTSAATAAAAEATAAGSPSCRNGASSGGNSGEGGDGPGGGGGTTTTTAASSVVAEDHRTASTTATTTTTTTTTTPASSSTPSSSSPSSSSAAAAAAAAATAAASTSSNSQGGNRAGNAGAATGAVPSVAGGCSNGVNLLQQHHQLMMMIENNGVGDYHPSVQGSERDRDIVRLIGQHLRSLGLQRTANALAEESGCILDHPLAAKLKNSVMSGRLDAALSDVNDLERYLRGSNAKLKMHFLILEQKFFELLAHNKTMEALHCLRDQLSPLKHNLLRIHELSSCLMITDSSPMLDPYRENVGVTRLTLIERLQKFVSATVMLPPKRLRSLLAQAQYYQMTKCPLHNIVTPSAPPNDTRCSETPLTSLELRDDISLLSDHLCDRSAFPSVTTQVLTDHSDEVWACAWSHSGLRLATGSKDSTVILWDLCPLTLQLTSRYTLEGHTYGIFCLSWSPDDSLLLVCGSDESSDVWMWDTNTGALRQKISYSPDDSLTACGWQTPLRAYNALTFVVGGCRGQFYYCDLEGNIIDSWEGYRVIALSCLGDGKTVLAADTHNRIRRYCTDDMQDEDLIREDHSIVSFAVDRAARFVVVALKEQGLHLWDIQSKTPVRRFRGVTQHQFTVQSCFGGVDDNFIASGSEDAKVYIFNRAKETPVEVLSGHQRTVNCVAWNPHYPELLVSASDDGTVRVWGPKNGLDDILPYLSTDSGSTPDGSAGPAETSGENADSDNEMAD